MVLARIPSTFKNQYQAPPKGYIVTEEIAAKLGDTAEIAAQFNTEAVSDGRTANKAIVAVGLSFTCLVVGLFFILLAA